MKIQTLIAAAVMASSTGLLAQTYTWRPGDASGGTGTWDTTTANWNSGPQVVWPSSGTANEAVFGGTAGAVTIATGGVTANKLTFDTTGYTISGAGLTLNGTAPTFAIGSGSATISSLLSGSAGFTKSGEGTLLLNGGANPISGTVNVNGGILQVSATGANQDGLRFVSTVNIDNATMQLLGTQANRLNGTGALTVQNGGVLDAAGSVNNQHNLGLVTLNGGTLMSSDQALTNGNFVLNNTVTVGGSALSTISAASISMNNAVRTFNVADVVAGSGVAGTDLLISSVITGGGGLLKTGEGTLRLTGLNNFTQGTTVNAGTLILDSTGKTNPALGILPTNSNLTISNAAVSLVGTAVNNIYNWSGGTVTITSGTLSADQTSNNSHHLFNVVLDGGVLTTGTTGSFFLNGAVTSTGTAMSTISAPLNLQNGARTFNVGDAVAGTDLLVSSQLSNGGITKTGLGTMALTGTNTYTGATTVSAGTLLVSSTGSINNSSTISVEAGAKLVYNSSTARTGTITLNGDGTTRAILGGNGTISTALTLNNLGDTLSPGNSPGLQVFNVSQTWDSFTYLWEVNDWDSTTAGTGFDQINITGGLTLNVAGSYALDITSLTLANVNGNVANFSEADRSWTILSTTTGITNFNADLWSLNTGNFTSDPTRQGTFSLTQSGNNLVLNYAAIPEPSTSVLIAISLTAFVIFRRRRHTA